MNKVFFLMVLTAGIMLSAIAQNKKEVAGMTNQVKTTNGIIEGTIEGSGIHSFKGIPYAAPPVGELRWKEPQPVQNWQGVRKADKFGPRAMQRPVFSDMVFRSDGVSEDCLYLNVWTPARSGKERMPVLVYFYGGGMIAGDGSELRYDGGSMAQKGIVALTVNYRLSVFGFLAHPELTAESPHHASGNYALMDQAAALRWVQQNIAAFGGDPKKVTIAGESAGSFSVSAQMASPLSKNLMAGAIGESGSLLGRSSVVPLAEAEQNGVQFATTAGAASLSALRAMPATQLLEATAKPGVRFPVTIDGYFFPESPVNIFAAGKQAHVPLLVGWNSEEGNYKGIVGGDQPTTENYTKAVQKLYGDHAPEVLKAYAVTKDEEVEQVATDLASDRFIGFSTWKWADMQGKTGGRPVYRYLYAHPRPATNAAAGKMPATRGAVHSAEIEYAMGNLSTNKVFAWTPDDYKVSQIMQDYFANFIKKGDPNSPGLPAWPAANKGNTVPVMHIDVNTHVVPEQHRERYLLMDQSSSR